MAVPRSNTLRAFFTSSILPASPLLLCAGGVVFKRRDGQRQRDDERRDQLEHIGRQGAVAGGQGYDVPVNYGAHDGRDETYGHAPPAEHGLADDYRGQTDNQDARAGGDIRVALILRDEAAGEGDERVGDHECQHFAAIRVYATDSTKGLNDAMEGKCDIAMVSRSLKDYERDLVESTVIATDGIAVIVQKDNPINQVTKDELKGIFNGNITSWNDIQ